MNGEPTPERVRGAFAHLVSAVSVVTAHGPDGPVGMTVSALCTLTLDPPRLLLSFQHTSRTLAVLRSRGVFAVNVLPETGASVADQFATAVGPRRFHGQETVTIDQCPVLVDSLAWFICAPETEQPIGDHVVMAARVRRAEVHGGRPAQPLIRFRHGYQALRSPDRPAAAEPTPAMVTINPVWRQG
ncbi:flavin reductase family protein [Micromonospora sp. WMMD1102]|uniref:flavin reductase family protein n=1 Tax=Micromonospora sp. WMMD1102 TaxID=3016105 RepID=UPI00241513BE|nr:flavin reductase family protein [Micromonospora sp. WMMD1102]MDG4791633.1 flavin reductase family protein [Micromonospora sp. WMMD1102]